MIRRRIGQFLQALFGRIQPEDRLYVREWLPEAELDQLFWGMSAQDQYHAIHTAYTAQRLFEEAARGDRRLLIRCALLHDVGRVDGALGIWGKTAAVLLHHFFPRWAAACAEAPEGGRLAALLYVYFHHPALGAAKLRQAGYEGEADIVARHHAAPRPDDPWELQLLRRADDLN